MTFDPATGAIVAIVVKVLVDAAVTIPPPTTDAGFFRRWSYDFAQKIAGDPSLRGQVFGAPRPAVQAVPKPEAEH